MDEHQRGCNGFESRHRWLVARFFPCKSRLVNVVCLESNPTMVSCPSMVESIFELLEQFRAELQEAQTAGGRVEVCKKLEFWLAWLTKDMDKGAATGSLRKRAHYRRLRNRVDDCRQTVASHRNCVETGDTGFLSLVIADIDGLRNEIPQL
jgi:hypothetical protein